MVGPFCIKAKTKSVATSKETASTTAMAEVKAGGNSHLHLLAVRTCSSEFTP